MAQMLQQQEEDTLSLPQEGDWGSVDSCDVVISNGFGRFHLANAAAEINRRGRLARCFTGCYPTRKWRTWLKKSQILKFSLGYSLLDRRVGLPDTAICSLAFPEVVNSVGRRFGSESIMNLARHIYASRSSSLLPRSGVALLHYRSGFGHKAVKIARSAGAIALCDHSIAHPDLLEYLVDNGGSFPDPDEQPSVSRFWRDVSDDVNIADEILVCSDFVRETFVNRGYDPSRLHVLYYGVDERFVDCLDLIRSRSEPAQKNDCALRMIFAGQFSRRKGAVELVHALKGLSDIAWGLDLVGYIDQEIAARFDGFLLDQRVNICGVLTRHELAERLLSADILVFPSLAEGSARVVFDALAAGCYVITTKNSGSIVKDGVHGGLVEPGNILALQDSIRAAHSEPSRVAAIGRQNSIEIRQNWLQAKYGDKLIDLYETIKDKYKSEIFA